MINLKNVLIGLISVVTVLGYNVSAKEDKKENPMKDTAIFKIDNDKKEVISLIDNIKNYLKFKFVSVTTDQPMYWPNEDVFLKVLMPAEGSQKLSISIQKKDSTPVIIDNLSLNEGGILVHKILSGKDKKIEAGEYRIDVTTADKKLQSYTSFSVVEGSLGAVSFGYDFEEITDPKKLNESKGGWFLGNAGGVGSRWGNGLNVKNEIRYFNKPYNGDALIKSRCFLSGCNGVEAGPEVKKQIKDGLLETVMDVSSHSGPFEIEVITDKGTIRNLFDRSGHVERQPIKLASNLTNNFNATLAPYENTIPVYGREIYIEKLKDTQENAFELVSPICDEKNKIELKVHREIINPKIFVLSYTKSDDVKINEIKSGNKLEENKSIEIECSSPYNFIAIAGFTDKGYYEAWALVFTQSSIDVDLSSPDNSKPVTGFDINIKTIDRFTGKGIPMYGILEVYDNRVPSKSAKEPLVSSLGDSARGLTNYLVSWIDMTGIKYDKEKSVSDTFAAPSLPVMVQPSVMAPPSVKMAMPTQTGVMPNSVNSPVISSAESVDRHPEITEAIREGEQKVVYCAVVQTDKNGSARVNVTSPPQTGRCKIRFVGINKFDYGEKLKDIDIKKDSFVEINIQPLLMPGAEIWAKAHVENLAKDSIKLQISGAGLDKDLRYDIKPGSEDIEFPVKGEKYGSLNLVVTDAGGKAIDKREIKIKNISSIPVTYSDLVISDGKTITVDKGKRIAVYANPAQLLKGILMNINTTMYSWFGHSEALSASVAVRGILLRAISDKIIDDEGLRDTLKSDLIKIVKDLNEKFYDAKTYQFCPYPGLKGNDLWSIWTARNLSIMVNNLESSKELKKEFKDTIKIAKEMVDKVNMIMIMKKKISIEEENLYDLAKGQDMIPVEINGKVVYKAITDDAVVRWYVDKMLPILDIPERGSSIKDINIKFIKAYDTYRFLRAFERTGNIYYLLLNAKALFLKGDKNFYPLFNQIAKGLILTQEPGMIQGPALLGGVYSSPQTVVKFLDLLITMAKDKKILSTANIEVINGTAKEKISVSDKPAVLEPVNNEIKINSPEYVTVRMDEKKEINIYEYLSKTPFFNSSTCFINNEVIKDTDAIKVGEEAVLQITLDNDRDPSEYYAVIAVPSVFSIRQTEDLLSDYKGQLLYGQRAAGGTKIQFLTVPFRGSRVMVLNLEATQKGRSDGYVFVRHISNPDIVATGKIGTITVK